MSKSKEECMGFASIQQPAPLVQEGNIATNWREWKAGFDYFLIALGRETASAKEKCGLFMYVIGKYSREIYEELDLETEKYDYNFLCKQLNEHCDLKKILTMKDMYFLKVIRTNGIQKHKDSFHNFSLTMEEFCRACLMQYHEPTELIQYTEKNRRLFIYSTSIQVKRNDSLTFQLCKDCYLNMKMCCKFKKMCKNSEKKLRNYLAFKGAGENVDFTTFLKSGNDYLFRLPMSGNSPGINKMKDEDNESTCTSIQNFISDLMESEEIPTTEARIIREVIEEEADIFDDSLDSHWLEDEDSVDTDFRLDFSFSPFLTPQHIIDDHCYTPKKLGDEISLEKSLMLPNENTLPFEVDQQFAEQNFVNSKDLEQKCTIDRNLEKALQNEKNDNFFLHDLLVTPPLCPNVSGPPTPLITNILFGDKLDTDTNAICMQKVGQCIENDQPFHDNNEILQEFFAEKNKDIEKEEEVITQEYEFAVKEDIPIKNETHEVNNIDIEIKNEIKPIILNNAKFNITNFYCKMCNKQFKTLAALKVHCSRSHKLKIKHKNPYTRKTRICDHCGKSYYHLAQFIKHIKSHNEPKQRYICKCSLKFSSESKLKMHMTTHIGKANINSDTEKKKFVCSICGAYSTSATNLKTHLRRHSKNYSIHCKECGRGFYRKSDLTTHYRLHTGEKPFPCEYCKRSFARRDVLNRHMKCHTGEKPFECKFCSLRYAKMTELRAHLDRGKLCLQMRSQQDKEEKPVKETVSVFYATVVGTNVYLDNRQDQSSGN